MRLSQSQRKYSLGLLEEAYRLSKEVGPTEACRQSGVKTASLGHFISIKRKEAGVKPRKGYGKMTHEQKCECLKLARHLKDSGWHAGMRPCWIEAGKRLGINGRSVEFQYVRGLWNPEDQP